MKIFWPYHSKAKGFSIENFADKHGKEIENASSSKKLNEFPGDSNLKSIKRDTNNISTTNLSRRTSHWANRDFSEYKEAA